LVTATGRYLLEASRKIEQEPSDGPGDIIVQPTFEVTFLSPSPGAEAEIARFAQRVGHDVGVLFRITKASVRRAAACGLDASAVLGPLRRRVKNPIPPNVEHEIRDWLDNRGGVP